MLASEAALPLAHPGLRPRVGFKRQPADFCVDEQLGAPPASVGPHLYLRTRKVGLETPELALRLARFYGVPDTAVGYAGRKDKRSVATQWFSVATDSQLAPRGWSGCTVRERGRGPRKLRPGDHVGNGFRIRLRGVDGDAWAVALQRIARHGVPNYFGPQRFAGNTLQRAQQWLQRRNGHAVRVGWYLSVLRSSLFNRVLAERVADGTWNKPLDGDVLQGALQLPTGPLWGRGRSAASGAAELLEKRVLE